MAKAIERCYDGSMKKALPSNPAFGYWPDAMSPADQSEGKEKHRYPQLVRTYLLQRAQTVAPCYHVFHNGEKIHVYCTGASCPYCEEGSGNERRPNK